MLVIPIGVDVAMSRWPWMNWVIMALTFFSYFYCWRGGEPTDFLYTCVAGGDSWWGHLLHPLAHLDFLHLAGNLLFLWVFGNAICAKVGNLWYPVVYFGLGLASSLLNELLGGGPGVGASAAINGITGIFLIWYALNTVRFFWILGIWGSGDFEVSAYWAILAWLAFDIVGALGAPDGVGHGAHLAGLGLGIALGCTLIWTGLVVPTPEERSLLQVFGLQRGGDETAPRHRDGTSRTAKPSPGRGAGAVAPPRVAGGERRGAVAPLVHRGPVDDEPIPLADEPDRPIEKRAM